MTYVRNVINEHEQIRSISMALCVTSHDREWLCLHSPSEGAIPWPTGEQEALIPTQILEYPVNKRSTQ